MFQRCALRKFRVTDGQNTRGRDSRDQIAFCGFYSFLVDVKTMLPAKFWGGGGSLSWGAFISILQPDISLSQDILRHFPFPK